MPAVAGSALMFLNIFSASCEMPSTFLTSPVGAIVTVYDWPMSCGKDVL